jgi:hypothetical protein
VSAAGRARATTAAPILVALAEYEAQRVLRAGQAQTMARIFGEIYRAGRGSRAEFDSGAAMAADVAVVGWRPAGRHQRSTGSQPGRQGQQQGPTEG